MKINNENGYIVYEIDSDNEQLVIEQLIVFEKRRGTGTILLNEAKEIARAKSLSIGLYSAPLDNSISEQDLREFYFKNGFELDTDDIDGNLFIY